MYSRGNFPETFLADSTSLVKNFILYIFMVFFTSIKVYSYTDYYIVSALNSYNFTGVCFL